MKANKKLTSIFPIAIISLSLQSSNVYAVGCDACLQAKIQAASSQISRGLSDLNSSANNAVNATDTVNDTIKAASDAYISVLETNSTQLLSSLDAATNKLEFSNEVTTTTFVNLTNTLNNTINTNAKNQIKVDEIFRNEETWGPDSLPISGAIALNRAEALSLATVEFNGRLEDQMTIFREWAFIVGKGDETQNIRLKKVTAKYEKYRELIPLLSTGLLTDETTKNLLTLNLLIVLPEPIDYQSLSTEKQIQYNIFVERKAAAFKVLAKEILMKAPLLKTDSWDSGYTQIESENGFTSLEEFMHSESDRKLVSSLWYDNIATLTEVGLLREQVHQTSMQNYLLNSLIETQKDNVLLRSLGE